MAIYVRTLILQLEKVMKYFERFIDKKDFLFRP